MALVDDLLKGNATKGIAIGIGVAVLAPIVLPVVAKMARPVVRNAIKGGIIVYEKGRETAAELGEMMDDIVAEAKAELESEESQMTAPDSQEPQEPPTQSNSN